MSIRKGQASEGGGGDFTPVPAGSHPCVCVAVIDLGTHEESYQGQDAKKSHKIALVFELHELDDDGNKVANHFMAIETTFSLGKKAKLRAIIEGWRGKALAEGEELDFTKLLGAAGMAKVIEQGKYTNLASVQALPKGLKRIPATVTPIFWELEDGTPPPNNDWLPFIYGKPISAKIQASIEWQAKLSGKPATAGKTPEPVEQGPTEEEIPF